MEFNVLGPLAVLDDGRPVAIGPPRVRTVLALLLVRPGELVSMDQLVDELWPDLPPPDAAARLVTRKPGYLLRVDDGELDLHRFERLVRQAADAHRAGSSRRALGLYERALAQWRGAPFADVTPTPTVAAAAARLAELRLVAQEDQFDLALDSGGGPGLVADLTELVAAHPLRERLVGQLMLTLYRTGRAAEALTVFDRARGRLAAELGIDPGPALLRRHEQVLRADPELDPTPEPAEPPARPTRQLPADLADFVGRDAELAEVTGLVSTRSEGRPPPVVVVTGGPGVGKSSLAVHAAHRLAPEFPDGQLYLDLAGTSPTPRDPAVMLAEALHALDATGIPDGHEARSALYRTTLADRRVLVVLDDAADAAQVRPLVPAAGGCAVLVTSRRSLPDLVGARHVRLDVLGAPDARLLLAGILGADRVAAEPEQAGAIAGYCDHLPLAIRIAGGKLAGRPAWPLRVLAERLAAESRRLSELRTGDLGVRTSFDLSVRALPRPAAEAFGLLGLLGAHTVPGWVVDPLLDRRDAEEALDSLVDANLVRLTGTDPAGQPRYRLHDLLRAYAVETAASVPEPVRLAAVTRYLATWLSLAESAADGLGPSLVRSPAGDSPRRWPRAHLARQPGADPLVWFDSERSTLLAAVALAADWGLDEQAWELATVTAPYFDHRTLYKEWWHGHSLALRVVRDRGNLRGEAELLRGLAQVEIYRDQLDRAAPNLRRAERLYERLGDRRGRALAIAGLATVRRVEGDYPRALAQVGRALDLVVAEGDRHTEAQLRKAVGAILLAQGDPAGAGVWFDQALGLARELGDTHREGVVLREMSKLHTARGHQERALRSLYDALDIFEELDDERCVALTLLGIGRVHAIQGTYTRTGPVLERAAMIFENSSDHADEAACWQVLGDVALACDDSVQARRHFDRARRLRVSPNVVPVGTGRR